MFYSPVICRITTSIPILTILDDRTRLISPLRPWLNIIFPSRPNPLSPHDICDTVSSSIAHDPFSNRFSRCDLFLLFHTMSIISLYHIQEDLLGKEVSTYPTISNHHIRRHTRAMVT